MGRKVHKNDSRGSKPAKLRKLEEWGLEEIDLELETEGDASVSEGGDADRGNGPKPLKSGTLIGIFLCMAMLSSIISAILWYLVH